MNWQAVIDSLREDAKLEGLRATDTHGMSATQAAVWTITVATSGLQMKYLADALQMGLNKRNES